MKYKLIFVIVLVAGLFAARPAFAHCPLCTIGAGLAVTLGAWLGLNSIVIGILVGGFAIALGGWTAKLIKSKKIRHQDLLATLGVFLLTIIPIVPFAGGTNGSIYISLAGEYGSWLNRTYSVSHFLLGSLLGGLVMLAAPVLSSYLSQLRQGKRIAFQGVITTLSALLVMSLIFQLVI